MEIISGVLSSAFTLIGIWIALEVWYFLVKRIIAAFQDPPSPNQPAHASAERPIAIRRAAYRPLAVALYSRLRSTA